MSRLLKFTGVRGMGFVIGVGGFEIVGLERVVEVACSVSIVAWVGSEV